MDLPPCSVDSLRQTAVLLLLCSSFAAALDTGLVLRYSFDGTYSDDAWALPLAPSGMLPFVAGREVGSLAASFSPTAGTLPGGGSHLSSGVLGRHGAAARGGLAADHRGVGARESGRLRFAHDRLLGRQYAHLVDGCQLPPTILHPSFV